MFYRMCKKSLGTSKIDHIFEKDFDFNIIAICYVDNYGFFFLTQENHCVGLLSLKGEVILPWCGKMAEKGSFDGYSGTFEYPSSLCYSKANNSLFIVDYYGRKIRVIDLGSKYIKTLIQGELEYKLDPYFSRLNLIPVSTSCDINGYDFFWSVREINRIFRFNQYKCQLGIYMGNGKSDFSVSNDLRNCSLKMPSSIRFIKDNMFICDSGNKCIRSVNEGKDSIFIGNNMIENEGLKLQYPTKCRFIGNYLYFVDINKIKQMSLIDKKIVVIKECKNELFIDTYGKDLYVMESDL